MVLEIAKVERARNIDRMTGDLTLDAAEIAKCSDPRDIGR
jgi:hypothetical protein